MKPLTAIDLFTGCGGLTLGLKRAGINVVAGVELDELAATSYKANHPEVLLFETDIRGLTGNLLRSITGLKRGELDLLAGCPPCQGFSTMTRKNKPSHAVDDRNDLIFEMLRLIKQLHPRAVLLENVPGLKNHWRFGRFITELRRMGYKYDYGILNAMNFRVPQRRKRLILMASRKGEISLPKGSRHRVTVRQTISGLKRPERARDPIHRFRTSHSQKVAALIRAIPLDGGSRASLGKRRQLDCHKKFEGFKDVYGRMTWDAVAPTITGSCFNPSKGRFLHPRQMRAISLREAALLQTFPKSYRFPSPFLTSRSSIALMIGNALPPRFAEAQGRHLKRHFLISRASTRTLRAPSRS